MSSFSGTFSTVNDTSGILILQPQEVATITLTKTASNPWSVSLRQIIGGSAEVGLATYTTDQSAIQYKNTTNTAQTLRLRCMTLTSPDTIAYAFADAPASDVVFSWSDPEGNLLFSITEAGPVVPSNVTLTTLNATNMAKGADIASAATIDLTNATGNWVNVTGTTTITAITLSSGLQRLVRFTGILTLTNGASLVLPGAANITTAAGDYALFIGDASGVVRCAYFSRATGAPVGPAAAGTLTGSTLASNVVSSSLTTVGTLASGLAIGQAASVTPYTPLLTAKGAGGTFFVRDNGGEVYFYGGAQPYYFGTAYAGASLVITSGNGGTALTLSSTQGATFASTVNHASTISVGAATPSNSGAGVSFPSTQSASSDVNTLDDYKEGTWTPVITAATPGNLAVTYSTQSGKYTKIGNAVTVTFYVATTAFTYSTASGLIYVTGLPYAAGTTMFSAVPFFQGYTSVTYPILGVQMSGTLSNVYFTKSASGQAPTNALITDFPTAGTVQLTGSFTYYV